MTTLVLIAINVVVSFIAFGSFRNPERGQKFLFSPYQVARGENYLGAVLSQFSHADLGHLFFNMLTLWFFAPVVSYLLSDLALILIYVLSGACAVLLTYVFHKENPQYRALGASGSVSGVIFAGIVLYPAMSLYLFFIPVAIPGPIFAIGYIVISIYLAKRQRGNIGHEAHIGGAVAGFILAGLISPAGFDPLLRRIQQFIP